MSWGHADSDVLYDVFRVCISQQLWDVRAETQTPGELVDSHRMHGISPLQPLDPINLHRIVISQAASYLLYLPFVALLHGLLDQDVVILR